MLLSYVDSLEKFLIFLFTLSVLVVVHEGGHFWVARWNGVAVTEFAVGFGPAIASIRSKRSGTRYRLNLFPIGGYCAMLGEDNRNQDPDDPIECVGVDYAIRAAWQRFAIICAGPLVNLIAAFVILLASTLILGVPGDHSTTKVGQVIAGDPAERAGLRSGDTIIALDGRDVSDGLTMVHKINSSIGKTIDIRFLRAGIAQDIFVKPIPMMQHGRRIGITGFMPVIEYHRLGPMAAIESAWKQLSDMWSATITGLNELLVHTSKTEDDIVGPVGMARAGVAIQSYGAGAFLSFAAFISLSLGVFNLLPIPALDGGRILFIVIEVLRGRPIDPEKEAMVHFSGFAALLLFVLFRTYHDIVNMVAVSRLYKTCVPI